MGASAMRRWWPLTAWMLGCVVLCGCGESDNFSNAPASPSAAGVFVYWDTNEEQDVLLPSGQIVELVPPYDPNGQMCIVPDGSGRFATGYNPTLPSQHNPGSLKPLKNPPVGMAMWDPHGNFTGQTIYVPGPYGLASSDIGGDIPPDPDGNFNGNGTFTGCAFDSHANLYAADIGQAQGTTASPDQGRIIEWFAPDYTSFCFVAGPTRGGDGPHHVNGSGGLRNPGIMAVDRNDDLYIPESGASRVLKFDHTSFPQSTRDCDADGFPMQAVQHAVFISGGGVPAGIAWDPTCNCWAVSKILALGGAAIAWYDVDGHASSVKGPVPPGAYHPFGLAVSPTGDVFFVDIGLSCDANGCGTTRGGGGIFKVSFTHGVPSTPQLIFGGLNFPTSVTVCDASKQVCPQPAVLHTPAPQPGSGG